MSSPANPEPFSVVPSEERLAQLEDQLEHALQRLTVLESERSADLATMVVFSGDFDRIMAALNIATGAAAMETEVSMFFTFWGLAALKKKTIFGGKTLTEKLLTTMFPGGADSSPTSKLNMLGLGPVFFKHLMGKHNVSKPSELVELAQEMGVRMVACQMSMDMLGIKREELIEGIDFGGVATYLGDATRSKVTLFI